MEIMTHSPEQSMVLAETLARFTDPGTLILFFGEMGAGKTTFTKGLAKGLGIEDEVHSPTFTLIHEHSGPKKLCHADLYRLERSEEIDDLGLEEYIYSDAVTVVEWSERFGELPRGYIRIDIRRCGDNERLFAFSSDYKDEGFFETVKKEYLKKCTY